MVQVSLYLDKRRVNKDGKHAIRIYARHIGQITLTTGYCATQEEWDGNGFTRKADNYKMKNMALQTMMLKMQQRILEFEASGRLDAMEDKELQEELKAIVSSKPKKEKRRKTLLEVMEEFVAKKKNTGTKTVYTTTMNKLKNYDPGITIDKIDRKWLEAYEEHMAETMKVNAYAIHLRNIRAVMNYAIDEEYTTNYPFRKFSIKKEETRKRFVPIEKLRLLRDYPCEEYQERYRDLFMLMIYMIGINAADLFTAKASDVVNGRLEYKRAKTGRRYSIKIEPEAQAIIDKYRGSDGYLLNIMNTYGNYKDFLHRMDVGLKQIGTCERRGLGGKKYITPLVDGISTYWSRHTWASLAAQLEVPKETIAHALGHAWASSTTTDIYILFDERKVDDANRRVIDLINGE